MPPKEIPYLEQLYGERIETAEEKFGRYGIRKDDFVEISYENINPWQVVYVVRSNFHPMQYYIIVSLADPKKIHGKIIPISEVQTGLVKKIPNQISTGIRFWISVILEKIRRVVSKRA